MNLNMSMLDMTFVGLLSFGVLLLLFTVLSVVLGLKSGSQLKQMTRRRPKMKNKRKRWKRACHTLNKQRKSHYRTAIVVFLLGLLLGGSGFYARHYQLTNLSSPNAAAISKCYYLLDEAQQQFENLKGGASPEKTVKNLQELSSQLASAASETPYGGMSADYRLLLNKYFKKNLDLAINLNAQTVQSLQDTENIEIYMSDIQSVKEQQQKIIEEFEVNEQALLQKK
ncbi:hypothetical protein I6N96_09405 [Enterococcus sp. BWM-S5]|uniref:5-bromo-4-chloroindolyl phosphate hydrolysis protein n=1 Tax=Enterococcus larvae TaxID=2794352 RepID=A0ABS4CIQ3_9ENTE|nr:hypothetical protein [Enterococcus larvae]MBP1046501.1 hypothetical protein [Enterococcus larvae]